MILYPWQEDFLTCRDPVQVWVIPRQSGKSFSAILKANQNDSVVIVCHVQSIIGYLLRLQQIAESEGYNPRPQIFSNEQALDIQWSSRIETLIIDEATRLDLNDLNYYFNLYEAGVVEQLIFMGTPTPNMGLVNFCLERNIPVHRTRQAHYHNNDNGFMERTRYMMTELQWMNEILGMYSPEIERQFISPPLKEYDLCELLKLPRSH